MERISKALELARQQSEQAVRDATAAEAVIAQPQTFEPHAAPEPDPAVTGTFGSPMAFLHPHTLEHEHILPPQATGPQGKAYKLLRTQVLQRLDHLKANTLAVMSPNSGQGNTLTAINLAIAISAELGRTALLVDLNLRNPSVHRRLGYEPRHGVESVLRGICTVQEVIVRVAEYDRLALLPAKHAVDNSSELLSSEAAAALMNELRNRYSNRIMIFDLPPVLEADDALAFSRVVQAGLVVVTDGQTQKTALRRTMEMLGELPIVDTMLNGERAAGKPRN